MKMHKKTITICSSASFYKQVLQIEQELKQLGFSVKIPKTARVMEQSGDFDVSHYKTWYGDASDYKKKSALIKAHFEETVSSDAILVINGDKNGYAGYIGGNVVMEMGLAFYFKKPIYIWKAVDERLPLKEEVYGVLPIIIHQDLHAIL
jgi:hypothetical protein